RAGQADPGLQATLEPVPPRRLCTDRAVVATPQKTHEAQIGLVRLGQELVGGHARTIGRVPGAAQRRRSYESLPTPYRPRNDTYNTSTRLLRRMPSGVLSRRVSRWLVPSMTGAISRPRGASCSISGGGTSGQA